MAQLLGISHSTKGQMVKQFVDFDSHFKWPEQGIPGCMVDKDESFIKFIDFKIISFELNKQLWTPTWVAIFD